MSNTSSHIRKVGALVLALVMLFSGRAGAGAQAPRTVQPRSTSCRDAGLPVPRRGVERPRLRRERRSGAPALPMSDTSSSCRPRRVADHRGAGRHAAS